MSKLKPVVDSSNAVLNVNGMSLAEWGKGKKIYIQITSSSRHWNANLFRFTDEDGANHSVLFVEDVPPEEL